MYFSDMAKAPSGGDLGRGRGHVATLEAGIDEQRIDDIAEFLNRWGNE